MSSWCEDAAAVRRRVGEDRRWEARGGMEEQRGGGSGGGGGSGDGGGGGDGDGDG